MQDVSVEGRWTFRSNTASFETTSHGPPGWRPNWTPRAAGLAAELDREFGTSTRLIRGANGDFEIVVDGELVFSKRSLGRFPDDGEVAGIIRGRS
jgi:selT/selW/selH-like putative selenoprotein